ncbi:transposase [Humitalea rosea]|uniref:Transposase n=1 Tax=Humitalea rosea TaxID=990373 RepID=A0A2W7I8G9_9PROT|nr:transposase [Humitalea rosea]
MIDPERIGAIIGEALLAGALGALGAVARLTSTGRPMLSGAFLLHTLAGGSLGTGAWLVARVPHGHWKTMTFLAALRSDRIEAPCVVDGPINGVIFAAWVQQFLVPTLKPGDVVVLDNLGSHKGVAVRRAIRAAGAHLLFLPPYSPDLNPIEMMFAKLKTLLRKADERSIAAVWNRIGTLLGEFSPAECAKYLKHAGYASM